MLPDYVGELAQALQEMKAWIATSGIADPATVEPSVTTPPTNPRPQATSNGESRVGASEKELLSL